MENNPYASLKRSLSTVPVTDINYACYSILANNLDNKGTLVTAKGYPRDYRGLAELIGFQYEVIKEFGQTKDPTFKILVRWKDRPDATLDKLISYLEDLDRHDIIEELIPLLGYTNGSAKKSAITRGDLFGEYTIYDAYVSFADDDFQKAVKFAQILESPRFGKKLFIRQRDMLAGCLELESNIEVIKNRCRHMLILLTPNFLKSPELEFQVNFAGSLAIDQKQRILIPVILVPCEIPSILRDVSKINLTIPFIEDWMWSKLIASLKQEETISTFVSSLETLPTNSRNGTSEQVFVPIDRTCITTSPQPSSTNFHTNPTNSSFHIVGNNIEVSSSCNKCFSCLI